MRLENICPYRGVAYRAVKSEVKSRRPRCMMFRKIKRKSGFSYFLLVTSFACYITLNAEVIYSSETSDCVPSNTALRTQNNVLFIVHKYCIPGEMGTRGSVVG
jgi:hypothetical protein